MKLGKSLRIIFLINSIFVFAAALLGPLYAVFVQGFDQRAMAVSISWASFILASTFFTLLVRKFGDSIEQKEFLLASGFLVRAIAWMGYVFVNNIWTLLVVQILLGLGEAFGTPAWNAIFANHINKKREIDQYSSWSVVSYVTHALGVLTGGIVVTLFGFKVLFIAMSFLALVSFIGVMITPRNLI